MFEKSIVAARPFKLALLASIALVAAGASAPTLAATSASASATANVIVPIAITKSTDLSFGKFAGGSGGTISLSTAGVISKTGVNATSGTPTVATFAITGEPSAAFTIDTTTGTSTTLSANAGADTMALTLITDTTAGGSSNPTTANLSAGGTATLYVGGTLTVAAAQNAGSYTGTVAVAVAYP
jgi:hypothetical protein